MEPVGRYQILEELGRGAHGVVYKALDPAIGRTIAIKAIAIEDTHSADSERVRDGIWGEARLAGTLSHPSIVAVYDVVNSHDAVFIVMEFVDGEPLERAISSVKNGRSGVLTRSGFLSIFKQVAQALDYAHRKGVIHRDVKPANIVVTGQRMDQTGELIAKIADFGVAKFSSHEVTQQLDGAPKVLVGTPNYMSPEQVEGVSLSGASDQFSLGVIAYEVLTGQKAFTAEALEPLLHKIRNEPEEPVNALNDTLSPTVAKVMQRVLAKRPEDRFTTCAEFAGALEFALGDSPNWLPSGVEALGDPAPAAQELFIVSEGKSGWGKTLGLIFALCLAVCLAIVTIVRMNSGSAVPTQILDTKNAPASPAPSSVDELKEDRGIGSPAADAAQSRTATKSSLPKVPVAGANPIPAKLAPEIVVKKPVLIRQVKQVAVAKEVQLSTDPPSANITVDGINSCLAPCSFTLPAGRHTLVASLSGYATARKIFKVPQELGLIIQLERSVGTLLVSSDPAGASVIVDGQPMGRTPIMLKLSSGQHKISVSDGARLQEQTVQISGDEMRTRVFRF